MRAHSIAQRSRREQEVAGLVNLVGSSEPASIFPGRAVLIPSAGVAGRLVGTLYDDDCPEGCETPGRFVLSRGC